jgi:hypothetical protein
MTFCIEFELKLRIIILNFQFRINVNEPSLKLSKDEEKTMCLIINTGEYCSTTITQLIESIKKTIGENYVDKLEMTAEQEEFSK